MNATTQIEPITGIVTIEKGLLGACLTSQDAFAVASLELEPVHFLEPLHQEMWQVMLDLLRAGRVANPVTIGAFLPDQQLTGDITIRRYIASLCADVFCPANAVADFARQVRSAWGMRQVLSSIETARAEILAPGADCRTSILDLMRDLDETRTLIDPRRSGFKSSATVACSVMDMAAAQYSGSVAAKAITTGVKDLDHLLGGGFSPGDLVILAGRPGMGKSVAAVGFSHAAAAKGHGGCLYSLEMTIDQIGARYISDTLFGSKERITSGALLGGRISEKAFELAADAAKVFGQLPLHIDDSSSLSVGEISARTRTMADKFARQGKRLGFVFIDYLKFVRATDRYRGQRHYEIGEISSGLKSLAKDLNIVVVLLAQLNRDVEKREDKRPQLSDLRESGDLEADADKVIMLFREEYYHAMKQPQEAEGDKFIEWMTRGDQIANRIEFLVEKNRMGATGKIEAFCDVGCSAIRDLAHADHLPGRVW